MRPWMHSAAFAAIGVGMAASLAACGNSSEASSSSEASDGKFTGPPVTVMTIAPINTAAINQPEILDVATAAVKSINAAGGLGGHEIKLINCNDGNDPNSAAACARQAVEKKAAAVVGGFSTNGATIAPVLEKAKIPWIAPVAFSANELGDQGMYPILSGATAFAALGEKAAADGCSSIDTVLYDTPATGHALELINAGVKAGGGQKTTDTKVPTTTTDFNSVARSASKADCAIVGLPTDQMVAVAKASQSLGLKTKFYLLSGALNATALKGAGGALEGAVSAQNFPVESDKAWSAAKASDGHVDWSAPYNMNTWAGYQVLSDVVAGASDVTAATVTSALDAATAEDAKGLVAPIDFTKPFGVPGLSRVFNRQLVYVKGSGSTVTTEGGFQDISKLFGQ